MYTLCRHVKCHTQLRHLFQDIMRKTEPCYYGDFVLRRDFCLHAAGDHMSQNCNRDCFRLRLATQPRLASHSSVMRLSTGSLSAKSEKRRRSKSDNLIYKSEIAVVWCWWRAMLFLLNERHWFDLHGGNAPRRYAGW